VKAIIARYAVTLALTLAGVLLACAQAPAQVPAQVPAQAPSGAQKPCSEPGDSSKSLSDKLDQGGGVICPPNVDPGIKAPTPETGKMPVILPPGSPGGDPKVQPK
jgi:hypothetical protein